MGLALSKNEGVMQEGKIRGVEFKTLVTHDDSRGFFREIIRDNDPFFQGGFAQWSHSRMAKNTVKAWHFHHRQIDWWYVGLGVIETVLFDNRSESPTYGEKLVFKLGDDTVDKQALVSAVRIPQGVLHGCKVLTDCAHLFYITSCCYNPDDEGRYPFNCRLVDHDWGEEDSLTVAANDRIEKIPPHPLVRSW